MDFLIKQRLIGAIVLVALAVIFIPMLLDSPKDNLVPNMEPLPEPEEPASNQSLEQLPVPLEMADEPEFSVVQSGSAAAEPAAAVSPAEAGTAPLPETVPEPESEPEPEPEPEPTVAASESSKQAAAAVATAGEQGAAAPGAGQPAAPGPLGNWVVQMGSFSSEQNALRLRDRLREAKFVTQVEKVQINGKTHFRVRVGPYLERTDAERDQKKLAQSLDLKGRVLAYP